jgi:hypothetical protein
VAVRPLPSPTERPQPSCGDNVNEKQRLRNVRTWGLLIVAKSPIYLPRADRSRQIGMATGIPLHPAECFRTFIQAEPQIESGPANEYAAPAVLEHLPTRRAACATGTDGACYHNPGGSSGCAAIVRYPEHLGRDDEQIVDFGCSESSNNRMELLACIRALRWIRSNSPWPGVSRVQIVTDSRPNAGDPQAFRV